MVFLGRMVETLKDRIKECFYVSNETNASSLGLFPPHNQQLPKISDENSVAI